MQLHGVSFLVTFRCPSKCEHCAYNAGPDEVGQIDLYDAKRWLSELVDTQEFEWLTLHGGEPFLYLDEIKAILRMAKEFEIEKRGAITNGYWARTPLIASRILKELIGAGLNRITFSVDGFHQQYIDIGVVKVGIEAAASLGIDRIWVDSYYIESLNAENIYDQLTKESLRELQGIEGIEYSLNQVDFEGRGANSLIDYADMTPGLPNGKCVLPHWLGGDLQSPEGVEIDFEGNVTLCPGICIGNAKVDNLSEILDNYTCNNHPIIRVLVKEGPKGLYRLAKQHSLIPISKFANECHLCFEMRRSLHELYPNHLAPNRCYQQGRKL